MTSAFCGEGRPIQIEDQELRAMRPLVLDDPMEHTMEESLIPYMDIKIHQMLKEREYKNIWIIGDKDRSGEIFNEEKKDKKFNWKRPSTQLIGDDLYVKVFPGREYVKHYATLIASYFAIEGRTYSHIRYVLPDESEIWQAIKSTNIDEIPAGDVAVLGYGLDELIGDEQLVWEGECVFSWHTKKIGDKNVVFIGSRYSYWGDISGKIVTFLGKKGFKDVIYVGKVGGMNCRGVPNQTLATGDNSFIEGETIKWTNLFDFAKEDGQVVFGNHYTIPSVMNETKEWLAKNKSYAFVDNEIGFMAKAAQSESMRFSYLHIISDNLNKGYEEDLSNERSKEARMHRLQLLQKAKALIEQALTQTSAAPSSDKERAG